MSFIVIEGDNSTGKDTLALKIQNKLNYRVITNEYNVKELNIKAKKYEGEQRINEFLNYGKICSDMVKFSNDNVILVRYWISTLAAAYADNIYTYEQTYRVEKEICSNFYKPDIIICLWCNYETRIERIKKRKALDFDDITKKRDEKYKWFLKQFEKRTNIKWINIDTTNKCKEKVFEEALKHILSDYN